MKTLYALITSFLLISCVPPDGGTNDARDTADPGGTPPTETGAKGQAEPTGPLVDLRYQFAPGQILTYKASEETNIVMSMNAPMGMPMPAAAGMAFHVLTETDFQLIIKKVNADGSAEFTCKVTAFNSFVMPGRTLMATHEGLAGDALEVSGTITTKGKVEFAEEVYVVVTEKGEKFYVRAKATENSASAEASDGETTVSVFAAYDPKTGKVTGGARTTVKNPRKTVATLKIKENDRRVDVLPKQIMELFALPENPARVGTAVALQLPGAGLQFLVESYENDLAKLKMSFAADTAAMVEGAGGEVPEAGGENADGENASGENAGGENAGGDSPAAAMPKMTGLVEGMFAVAKGQLQNINGKVKTEISSGMNVEITSTFSLKLQ